jgi:hypothetical protein
MSEKKSPDSMAEAFAVVYRLSQMLNVPLEDAAKIYAKVTKGLIEQKPH